MPEFFIGTAGWTIPNSQRNSFPGNGTHLERYASVFRAVEINSSFYRAHRQETYAKWSNDVPADFQFAVKMPKRITHERRLRQCKKLLDTFCQEISGLKDKLGCVLVQLPPSFNYEAAVAEPFFKNLRARLSIDIACEPRHSSWFDADAAALMRTYKTARVLADPATIPAADSAAGTATVRYYRLHGSPRMYYSRYTDAYLKSLAKGFATAANCQRIWCFFDNTAAGKACGNAQRLSELITTQTVQKSEKIRRLL